MATASTVMYGDGPFESVGIVTTTPLLIVFLRRNGAPRSIVRYRLLAVDLPQPLATL